MRQSPYTYYIDANSPPAEMMRLFRQHHLLTKAQGGLLAGLEMVPQIKNVLDIACGSGGWVLELAYEHPEMDVVGIDISSQMVTYANNLAELLGLSNASFRVGDAKQPLDFPEESFDLVNSRFIGPFMERVAWPLLFAECQRVLRPGGALKMTEFERALTTSPAHERLSTLLTQAQHTLAMGFSPDGNHMAVLPMLGWFFQQAGFVDIQTRSFEINYSFGEADHNEWYQNLLMFFHLSQRFLIERGVASQEEVERLSARAEVEMELPEFRAITPCLSVWGRTQTICALS